MRPAIKIDLNKAFANTRFMQDLSTVLYGAELALKRVGATDDQISGVFDEIINSTFASIEFNFDSINVLLGGGSPLTKPEAPKTEAAPDVQTFKSTPASYKLPEPDISYSIPESDIDFDYFEDNPKKNESLSHMYRIADKAYDSRMDEDEDLEHPDR